MPTCFVVQGFGEKVDLSNGRTLNLDASYQVIKEAVESAGLTCVRADEVVSSGTIDIPMYDWILKADLVIADLSTYNVNAAYELGVRYGVRPRATIIVAEEQFKNPFDVSHIVLHRYKHLGEDIGVAESRRFKAALAGIIHSVMASNKADSPIYELFPLDPPERRDVAGRSPGGQAQAIAASRAVVDDVATESAKVLLDKAREASNAGRWVAAKELLTLVHELRPHDDFVVRQLVLATYKDDPSARGLSGARELMVEKLNPGTTNDPETLGMWGTIHKRRWDLQHNPDDLDESIAGYERGFYLKQDYYNGINLAFLFNVRAAEHHKAGRAADAIADFVWAQRVRRQVQRQCDKALGEPKRSENDRYWIFATHWEAAVGLGDLAATAAWRDKAEREAERLAAPWMLATTMQQIDVLTLLLAASPLSALS